MRHARLLVAATVLVACAGCAVPAEHEAQVADDKSVPFALLAPDAPPLVPPATAARTEDVALCFVRESKLAVVERALDAPVGLRDAVTALTEPPAGTAGLRSALGDTSIVGDVQLGAGIASVDLRQAISTLGGDDQLLAVAQIVCTLTARPGVGQVSFTLEGAPVNVPRGDGSLVAAPVSRDDYARLLA